MHHALLLLEIQKLLQMWCKLQTLIIYTELWLTRSVLRNFYPNSKADWGTQKIYYGSIKNTIWRQFISTIWANNKRKIVIVNFFPKPSLGDNTIHGLSFFLRTPCPSILILAFNWWLSLCPYKNFKESWAK